MKKDYQSIGKAVAAVAALCILFFFGYHFFEKRAAVREQTKNEKVAKEAEEANRKAAIRTAEKAARLARLRLHTLCRYADSIGIDTSRYAAQRTTEKAKLDTLLAQVRIEIRYGKKPSQLAFSGLKGTIDSAWAFAGDESLSPKSYARVSSFLPYKQLVGHYTRMRERSDNDPATQDSLRLIRQTLNFYRYTNRFPSDRFVIVNIPAGELNVFNKSGDRLLPMQVIAGKPDRRTPTMTTYIQQIVAYPYWNVPRRIAVEEMLPRIKRNVSYLNNQNLQILDSKNQEVNPERVNWKTITAANFPYRIRQASGCENSLGLLKFNLANPLAIYLHDTNSRDLFTSTSDRWRSHGCVRVQKPVELANLVLDKEVFDDDFMNKCLVDQKPRFLPMAAKVPVFITYNIADVDQDGDLRFYNDVYELADK